MAHRKSSLMVMTVLFKCQYIILNNKWKQQKHYAGNATCL